MVRTLTQWSVADYRRMIESGLLRDRQVELIDGQIVEMAPELPIHRASYRRGVQYLESRLGAQAVIFATAPITLSDKTEPQPDICIAVPPESRYNTRHPEPADIYGLIEVSNSTLAYDLGEKATLYARNGIQDYWVMDIAGQQLWIHREPQAGLFGAVTTVSTGWIRLLAVPDIQLDVTRLLSSPPAG
ncbi:MAG: Uma2 family endonuclease [Thermosynechococcaceae cyanobacterium]